MKFAWKIFFTSFLIIIISFGAGGFLLVNSVFSSSLDSKIKSVYDANLYITTSLYALVKNTEAISSDSDYMTYSVNNFADQLSNNSSKTSIKIGNINDMSFYDKSSFINNMDLNTSGYKIHDHNGKRYLQAVSKIHLIDRVYYIESLENISYIYESRDTYCRIYQIILIGVALFSSVVLVIFSHFITKPLVKLSAISKEIADGNFSKRAQISRHSIKTKEVEELSYNFNVMSDYVENYIEQLKLAAESRDNFVADFTHELKTPLTAVIGYADMLRSYELDAKQRRDCADFIYKEGKRLEALSLNLLNIIVLKNNSIELVPVKSETIINETGKSVLFLLKKHRIRLETEFEHNTILAEPALVKTLLYNLIDNACKASTAGQTITLKGYRIDDRYNFIISDNGCGIPENELEKITEPFYMVDKSRARRMGGAGLGLALCNEIAILHGSQLTIKSTIGKGTAVSFSTKIKAKPHNSGVQCCLKSENSLETEAESNE